MRHVLATVVLGFLTVTPGALEGAQDVLRNGGFEEGAAGWSLNPAVAPAELEVISGEAGEAVHGGAKALMVRNRGGSSHIHQSGGQANVDYELRFWARAGAPVRNAEGAAVTPKVAVTVYLYGKPEENNGRNVFLSNRLQRNLQRVGAGWQEFRLPLRITDADAPGVKTFNVVLCIEGEVVVDDVVLQESEPWREKLLFHLPFDEGLDVAVAGGRAGADVRGVVRLVEGRTGKAASFGDPSARLLFAAEGNFDQAEGTIAMWVRPYWSEHDGVAHCFFEVPGAGDHASNPDASFVVSKGWTTNNTPQLTYCHTSTANYVWGQHISHAFGFAPNEWVHIAFSWSFSGSVLKLYKNGELLRVSPVPLGAKPPSAERPMIVGARNTGLYGADAAIDELMIFSAALSDGEVARIAGADPASAEPVSVPSDSSHINVVEMGLETPHIPFSRPGALVPVKALFLVACTYGRDVVELAQRCAVDFTAVVVRRRDSFGFDGPWYQQGWQGLSTAEKTREALARLDENPEAIVIPGLNFARIPGPVQGRILAVVKSSTGLVLINPLNLPAAISEVAEGGRAAILSGVPLAGMPDCHPDDELDPEALGAKLVRAHTLGAGRVVVIRWYDSPSVYDLGITPQAATGVVDRRYAHRCNYYLSLVGKALQWATGREPRVE